jgi:Skp family chaperone for outer membrane proteins
MGRRRQSDDLEGLVALIALALFCFGAVIIAFLKMLLLVFLIGGATVLATFLLYRLGRAVWERQLDIEAYLPSIDWSLPVVPGFDSSWVVIRYPEFPAVSPTGSSNIIGSSGAWKDVLAMLQGFPALRGASGPLDLQQRVAACKAVTADILREALTAADDKAQRMQTELEQEVRRLKEAEKILDDRVRAQLQTLQSWVEAMDSSGFWDRLRARRMRSRLSEYETRLCNLRRSAREKAQLREQAVRAFLNPAHRERTLRQQLQQDLARMGEIIKSKEFAGAVAEMAVIEELRALPPGALVFNDVKAEANRYIHFGGKPIVSAQIDTLVITTAGVFVIEVKNWSREFAHSREGFSPYEQASRAGYLVFNLLRSAGMEVRVRSIIATNGSLPEKEEQKVAVVPIRRLRRYIEGAPDRQVDVDAVRGALGL